MRSANPQRSLSHGSSDYMQQPSHNQSDIEKQSIHNRSMQNQNMGEASSRQKISGQIYSDKNSNLLNSMLNNPQIKRYHEYFDQIVKEVCRSSSLSQVNTRQNIKSIYLNLQNPEKCDFFIEELNLQEKCQKKKLFELLGFQKQLQRIFSYQKRLEIAECQTLNKSRSFLPETQKMELSNEDSLENHNIASGNRDNSSFRVQTNPFSPSNSYSQAENPNGPQKVQRVVEESSNQSKVLLTEISVIPMNPTIQRGQPPQNSQQNHQMIQCSEKQDLSLADDNQKYSQLNQQFGDDVSSIPEQKDFYDFFKISLNSQDYQQRKCLSEILSLLLRIDTESQILNLKQARQIVLQILKDKHLQVAKSALKSLSIITGKQGVNISLVKDLFIYSRDRFGAQRVLKLLDFFMQPSIHQKSKDQRLSKIKVKNGATINNFFQLFKIICNDKNNDVRKSASSILVAIARRQEIDTKQIIDLVKNYVIDDLLDIRQNALFILSILSFRKQNNNQEILQLLSFLVYDKNQKIRNHAIGIFPKMIEKKLNNDNTFIFFLIQCIDSQDSKVRLSALLSLYKLLQRQSIDLQLALQLLKIHLKDQNQEIRNSAQEILLDTYKRDQISSNEVFKFLKFTLKDPNLQVHAIQCTSKILIKIISEYKPDINEVFQLFNIMLKNKNLNVRRGLSQILQSTSTMSSDKILILLESLSKEKDQKILKSSSKALIKTVNRHVECMKSFFYVLKSFMMNSQNSDVRQTISKGLQEITLNSIYPSSLSAVQQFLKDLLNDQNLSENAFKCIRNVLQYIAASQQFDARFFAKIIIPSFTNKNDIVKNRALMISVDIQQKLANRDLEIFEILLNLEVKQCLLITFLKYSTSQTADSQIVLFISESILRNGDTQDRKIVLLILTDVVKKDKKFTKKVIGILQPLQEDCNSQIKSSSSQIIQRLRRGKITDTTLGGLTVLTVTGIAALIFIGVRP